jgi:hypothetical protein
MNRRLNHIQMKNARYQYSVESEVCVNCLCMKCANNVEEVWHKVKQEEQKSRASTVMNAAFILESISTECRGKRIAQVL